MSSENSGRNFIEDTCTYITECAILDSSGGVTVIPLTMPTKLKSRPHKDEHFLRPRRLSARFKLLSIFSHDSAAPSHHRGFYR